MRQRAKPPQLSLEDIRALNTSLAELSEVSKALRQARNQVEHAPEMTITSSPPTLTAGPRREVHFPVNFRRRFVIPVELGVRPVPKTRPAPVVPWLDRIAFFVPKSIREPFLGDLREDLTNKASTGCLRATVWCVAISQVMVLVLRWAWSSVGRH